MDNSPSQPEPRAQGKRRIGRFHIGHATFAHDWHAVLPLMAKVAILRAESLYHLDAIEYLALCDDFDEVTPDELPPIYRPAYRQLEGENGETVDAFFFTRQ